MVRLTVNEGRLTVRDQLKDYQDWGTELELMNLLDFFLETYEGAPDTRTVEETRNGDLILISDNNIGGDIEKEAGESLQSMECDGASKGHRPRNQRFYYRKGSGREQQFRVKRSAGHETMPDIIGKWFPRNDESTEYPLYAACILVFLKPWRVLQDIKGTSATFAEEFTRFMTSADQHTKRIIQNIQYFHECSDGASKRRQQGFRSGQEDSFQEIQQDEESDDEAVDEDMVVSNVEYTEADVERAREEGRPARDILYADVAIRIAEECGIFSDGMLNPRWDEPARQANMEDLKQYEEWEAIIKNIKKNSPPGLPSIVDGRENVKLSAESQKVHSWPEIEDANVCGLRDSNNSCRPHSAALLNADQRRAFDIINNHLIAQLNGQKPSQLLMIVIGQGGVGKSTLINAVTDAFEEQGAKNLLAKTATTGVAASIIGGTTLHWWGGLPIHTPSSEKWFERAGKAIADRRIANILSKRYLIVDEASMLTTDLITMTSQVTGQIHADNGMTDATIPFGGMNVIIGDFHQFPPVAKTTSTVYNDTNKRMTAKIGRAIYLQFDTVVILQQQMRISDIGWMEILSRLREGECTEEDIKAIRQLVMTNGNCDIPDFSSPPWSEATLVTPRHSVRTAWNKAALHRHCMKTGHIRYVCTAEDTKGRDRDELTLTERVETARLSTDKTGRLPGQTEIAIGMKALVTLNLATEADLANGTRGTITQIVLDPREEGGAVDGVKVLKYPPAMIMFQPIHHTSEKILYIEEGQIPIFPSEVTFTLHSSNRDTTITRRQTAIDIAYAFTDYRSQGQTLEYVIIDIGRPPKGPLSPFNAYVALSRSRGRRNIRLLRDFDESLFTHHPSEALREEDERLEVMDRETKERFELGTYSYAALP